MKFLVIVAIFLNTGIIQGVRGVIDRGEMPVSMAESKRKEAEGFAKHRIALAQERDKQGAIYSPYNYFEDLIAVGNKERTLGIRIQGKFWIDPLSQLMWDGIKRGYYSSSDISLARDIYGPEVDIASGLCGEKQNEKRVSWEKFFLWLVWFYFKNLFPTICLYLIWAIDERKKKGIPRPLSFVWRVVAHPFYLTKVFFEWFGNGRREFIAEARYRQTKENYFTYLSEREVGKIEQFAKSRLAISVWCRMLLQEGLRPRHTFVAAILVTLIFSVLPRPVDADAGFISKVGQCFIFEQTEIHLPRMSIDSAKYVAGNLASHVDSFGESVFVVEDINFQNILAVSRFQLERLRFIKQEIWQKIFHVPVAGYLV
ncbi:MAG: hypothetical protein WAX81_00320 [Candidatus Moraniibacteriota bacterium]